MSRSIPSEGPYALPGAARRVQVAAAFRLRSADQTVWSWRACTTQAEACGYHFGYHLGRLEDEKKGLLKDNLIGRWPF